MNHDHHNHDTKVITPLGGPKEYAKFGLVVAAIAAFSIYWGGTDDAMVLARSFMGTYMLIFGLFKLVDLKMFAHSYGEYDILTKIAPWWGFVYPFIEVAIGVMLLANVAVEPVLVGLLALMSFNTAGVVNELGQKNKIRCACLGKFVNLPITTITLTEDLLMVVMSGVMLLLN